ncbi:hypothetical protein [Chryseobacterium limigenitum]|uniref:Uncharacterized protein n=1 Tax=Chryseobacterium limigenitum TaxID=1612149 RepID=A0A1K2IS70_9FLAO|nr:hypothetical protein [Chryseobacterium limigenitum]SFZ95098.1 hypothetical protein SAMN05216324_108141 [Chryseobacterium limigenitum]
MKATKEQIIEIGCKIVKDIYKDEYLENTIVVKQRKVNLYFPNNSSEYYEHDGWLFMVDSTHSYGDMNDSHLIDILDTGEPVNLSIASGDGGNSSSKAIIKSLTGKYIVIDREDYFKHHNFDFTKKEFVKRKF